VCRRLSEPAAKSQARARPSPLDGAPSRRYLEVVRSRNPPDGELLEFTLVENGLDFVVKALGELRGDPDPRNLKYAVLHLKAGTDLLLKGRLRTHDC
jgi:hypothetical protein